jgi:hypothetical protein
MKEYGSTLRGILLVLALSCFALALCWTVGPLFVDDDPDIAHLAPLLLLPTSLLASAVGLDSDQYALNLAVFFGPLLLAQWMFLRPRAGWKIHLSETGRPMKTAVVAAAFMAMMLSFGAFALVAELFGFWNDVVDDDPTVFVVALTLALWLAWAVVFHFHWRKGTRFQQLEAMARGLIVGSLLELVVAAGVFAWKTDEDDCFCLRGSYVGLVFSATVMIWAFGPGLILLFLREARYARRAPQS